MKKLALLVAAVALLGCGSANQKVNRAADDVAETPEKVSDRVDEAGADMSDAADEGVEVEAEVKP